MYGRKLLMVDNSLLFVQNRRMSTYPVCHVKGFDFHKESLVTGSNRLALPEGLDFTQTLLGGGS